MALGKRVCLVRDAFDSLGGDQGWEAAARISILVAAGFEVHLLFTGTMPSERRWRALRATWSAATFHVPDGGFDPGAALRVRSYAIHEWLIRQAYDFVDFADDGSAFYAALAKRQALAHRNTILLVTTSNVADEGLDEAETFVDSPEVLQSIFMKEKVLEWADLVCCDCEHTASVVRAHREGRIEIAPPPVPRPTPKSEAGAPIREIVFLGDQTTENGFQEFIEAAEVVARSAEVRFTVIGQFGVINGRSSGAVAALALAPAGVALDVLAHLGHADVIGYLRRPGLLVVMPRRRTSTLALLIECALLDVSILASDIEPHRAVLTGSQAALIRPNIRLCDAILEALRTPPRPELRFDVELSNAAFVATLATSSPAPEDQGLAAALPSVSVCMVHFKRLELLSQALEALSNQTCLDFELILVDDGGEPDEVLDGLRQRLAACPFPARLIATDNIWLGAARNTAAAAATGDYLIFLDDDNIPMPQMLQTMRDVARRRILDIGTCLFRVLVGKEPPSDERWRQVEYLPTGGPASAGLIENVFGDANAIIRKTCFDMLGGFEPTPQVGAEDWDLFMRAFLLGCRIEVIATPLYFYRIHGDRLTARGHSQYKYYRRLLERIFDGRHPRDAKSIGRLALGRGAAELIKATIAEQNLHSPHGILLAALDAITGSVDVSGQYMILGQLMYNIGQKDDGYRLIRNGIDLKKAENEYKPDLEILIPSALLSNISVISSQRAAFVRFDAEKDVVMVHPMNKKEGRATPTTVAFPFPLPPGCSGVSVEVAVLHASAPAVKFTLAVHRGAPRTDETYDPYRSDFYESKSVRHKNGWDRLRTEIPQGSRGLEYYACITTHNLRDNSFAWAHFRNIRITL